MSGKHPSSWNRENPTLPLLLAGPIQSWGHQSQFTRRGTLAFPTQSGIVGLLAAAMGIDRNAPDHDERIAELSALRILVARLSPNRGKKAAPVLDDYHTVMNARTASGGIKNTELTRRHYLQDHAFIALVQGKPGILSTLADSLRNPRWGPWLGRRTCIPSYPVVPPEDLPANDAQTAWNIVTDRLARFPANESPPSNWKECAHVVSASDFDSGTDTWLDLPASFAPGTRRYHSRRVQIVDPQPSASDDDAFPFPLDA